MGDAHAPNRQRHAQQVSPLQRHEAGNGNAGRQGKPQQRQDAYLGKGQHRHKDDQGHRRRQDEWPFDPAQRVPTPAQQGTDGQDHQHRQEEDRADRVEIGRANRNAHVECLGQQRIKRAQQHNPEDRGKAHVVHHQRAFPAQEGESLPFGDGIGAQGEQHQCPADIQRQQRQDEAATLRVDGKGMDRSEDPRTHQERAQHAHGKGHHAQHDRPGAQCIARSQNAGRMQQRGGGKPGHQAGIFHRIPEPPAAPAQLVISPVGTGGDADGEEDPRGQHPRPHNASEFRRHVARDQRTHGKAESHRKADIADIKRGRMERDPHVLQQRIEAVAVGGNGRKPFERVGGQENEQIEAHCDTGLRAQRRHHHARRQTPLDQRDQTPGQRHHGDPQQHGPFMVGPGTGKLESQRLHRMGMGGDELDRKIGDGKGIDQRREGDGAQ